MRPTREITPEEENFRTIKQSPFILIRRDPVEREPVGTIILKAFRIVGYTPDCDGSLMAQLENVDFDGRETGWHVHAVGLEPDSTVVVAQDELAAFSKATP